MTRAPDTRRQRTQRRAIFVLIATLAVIGSILAHRTEPAAAAADEEAAFVVALNQIRADNGLPPFTVNSELSNLARSHAQVMADAGEIFHANPISAGYSGAWTKLGENVGVGANVEVLVDAFVASSGHFANIVDPAFTQVGVGVVWKDTALYTTHRFLQLPNAPAPTTAPPPPPTSAPTPTLPPPSTTVPAVTVPPTTTTTAPSPVPTTTTIAPLPEPAITAERVIALMAMLDQIGT